MFGHFHRGNLRFVLAPSFVASIVVATALPARAQPAPNAPTGAPPPEATAVVKGPEGKDAPKVEQPVDSTTNATVSAGGLNTTGNSRMLAGTVNGMFDMRRGANGFGASLLGNYGRSAASGGAMVTNVENLQVRGRYDRYLLERVSAFVIVTGRYDRFQGLDFRLNVDPGIKYLFINEPDVALWGEGGYDYQHDIRLNSARIQVDAAGTQTLLDKTADDHSARLFAGLRYAFNEEVTFSTGVEYLQSFIDSTRYRINYDAVFAAKIAGGLALGLGFSARYDHSPLPGKKDLDTATTVNLIYSYSDAKPPEPPKCPDCPQCPQCPICPPEAAAAAPAAPITAPAGPTPVPAGPAPAPAAAPNAPPPAAPAPAAPPAP